MSRKRGPLRALQRRWKDGWRADPQSDATRRAQTLDMLFFDHGLLRLFWRNLHEIAPGVWRSNQPDPGFIRRLKGRGIQAVLNLRGETEWGSYALEREACRAAGIPLVDFKLNSRKLPSREELLALDRLFADLPRPFLMHCKSGADRAGFAAALYLLLRTDATVAEAQAQLSWRYLHLRGGATGILHALLAAYAADCAPQPMPFRDWIATRYDPEAIAAAYEADPAQSFLVDRVLRRE